MVAEASDEQQDESAEEDAATTVQTKRTAGAPDGVRTQGADRVAEQVLTMPDAAAQRPNHTGLPDGLKSGVESLSGISMDGVKVHYNSAQPAQLNALAYTQGTDIHVAPGQKQHLPHEAWHVVQQAQGRVQPTMQIKDGVSINDDQGLEREADVMGARALAPAAQLTGGPGQEELLQGNFAPEQRTASEQGGATEHTMKSSSHEPSGHPAAQLLAASSAAMVMAGRPEEVAQRDLTDTVSHSPRLIAQQDTIRAVMSSPRMTAQRTKLDGLFGAAQLRSDPASAIYRLDGPVQKQDTDDAEETDDLEPDLPLPASYRLFAAMSAAEAKNRCLEAAQKIGQELHGLGYNVEYVCVVQWPKGYDVTSTNHYAAIGNGVVFDATGQQDPGGEACVLLFSDWLARVRSRCAGLPAELSRFVRGSLADCQRLSNPNQAYFWDMRIGDPVLEYSRKKIRKLQRHARKVDPHATKKPLPAFDFANESSDDN
jgi:hypothetical protein